MLFVRVAIDDFFLEKIGYHNYSAVINKMRPNTRPNTAAPGHKVTKEHAQH